MSINTVAPSNVPRPTVARLNVSVAYLFDTTKGFPFSVVARQMIASRGWIEWVLGKLLVMSLS
jgi:hypothetical protein